MQQQYAIWDNIVWYDEKTIKMLKA